MSLPGLDHSDIYNTKGFIELDMDAQWVRGRRRNRRHSSNSELADNQHLL
jgi:hypothetical protein